MLRIHKIPRLQFGSDPIHFTWDKMVVFRPNTTLAHNHQHPSMATCFSLF